MVTEKNDYSKADTSNHNFFSVLHSPDQPLFSGTSSAVLRVDNRGNLNTTLVSGTTALTINSEGRADMVQHSHSNNGWVHFESGSLSASQDYIFVDISDTTNYPHVDTSYIHLEYLRIHVDSDVNGNYAVQVGFLENVDESNGDFYPLVDISGTKKTGNTIDQIFPFYPNGAKGTSSFAVSSEKSLNDTAFQTDVNLASSLDSGTTDTPSGDGDLAIRVVVNAGSIIVGVEASYHTHNGG